MKNKTMKIDTKKKEESSVESYIEWEKQKKVKRKKVWIN